MPLDTDGRWTAGDPAHSARAETFRLKRTPILDDRAGHTISDTRGLFVLHAVLLHTGKVLVFGGHVEHAYYAPLSYVFDPKNPTDPMEAIPFPAGMDLFCCFYVQNARGRIVVMGGSDTDFVHHGSRGARNICIFNPVEREWAYDGAWRLSRKSGRQNLLHRARWYPTAVMLPDGRIMVVSGRPEHGASISIVDDVEVLTEGPTSKRDWSSTVVADPASPNKFLLPIYPGLHLAPDGRVFCSHTNWGFEIDLADTVSMDLPAGATTSTWTKHPNSPANLLREEAMSVLLPPAQDGKILVVGGTLALRINPSPPPAFIPTVRGADGGPLAFNRIDGAADSHSAEILNTKVSPPTWSPAPGPPLAHGRTNGHCVLLPDETVLICGGHDGYKWQATPATTPSLTAEIFTPGGGFRQVAAMNESRMYHSVALLLPDGRVLVAGGANPNAVEPLLTYPPGWAGPKYGQPTDPNPLFRFNVFHNRKTFEFYEPPYWFKPDRASQPEITAVRRGGARTERIRYGETFKVVTPQAASIRKVSFMRPGAPTHHTDSEQRYVKLSFTAGTGELTVTAVSDPKLAPPGYYMLWIVDDQGRPCKEAKFIHLVP